MAFLGILTSALAFTAHPSTNFACRAPQLRRVTTPALLADNAIGGITPLFLLAEDAGGGINPVFLLLGALPLVAAGAFTLVSGEEKKIAEWRADPANACRLGYTVQEIEKMEEMTRLRYEGDLKEFQAAVAEANPGEEPNGLTWLAEKASRNKGSYFDGSGSNERPTMI